MLILSTLYLLKYLILTATYIHIDKVLLNFNRHCFLLIKNILRLQKGIMNLWRVQVFSSKVRIIVIKGRIIVL